MSFRNDVMTSATPSSPPVGATEHGRVFLVGRTERGPLTPTRVRGQADFIAKFGSRVSTSIDMYDQVKLFCDEGGPEMYVQRAVGPTTVKASRDMATGGLVTTAKFVGAYGNAISVTYTSASKTLTVVADGVTETWTGADAAALVAAINAGSKSITATSNGTLPGVNQAAANLTGGDDDYANAVVATVLANLNADLGGGLVMWPGKDYTATGTALADHAAATDRLCLPLLASGASAANALTAVAALAAYTNASYCVAPVWPADVTRLDGVSVASAGFFAACRARAHTKSPGTPAWGMSFGQSRTGLVANLSTTDEQLAALDAARVNVIHTLYGITTLDGGHLATYIPTNPMLDEVSQRDTLNSIAHECNKLSAGFTGGKARRVDLAAWQGAMVNVLEKYVGFGDIVPPDPSLVPPGITPDPGYVIDVGPSVNTALDLAAGNGKAIVGPRVVGSLEHTLITIAASDQAAVSF